MADESFVLNEIHDQLRTLDPDLICGVTIGDTECRFFHDQVSIRASVHDDPGQHPNLAHCHIVTSLGTDLSGHLDACVVGIGADRGLALKQAATYWVESVSGVILSALHCRPVLNTAHFSGNEMQGVKGAHGFAGPLSTRIADPKLKLSMLADRSVFEFAAEIAPPGIVHLAKVTLQSDGRGGWKRTLEVDGHRASFQDRNWQGPPITGSQSIVSQFALFHFTDTPKWSDQRERLDTDIRDFVVSFAECRDTYVAGDRLVSAGCPSAIAHQIVLLTPVAFARTVFEDLGVQFAPSYYVADKTGKPGPELPLMGEPVFARSMILGKELLAGEHVE
ncbi:MAG: hypothetical protein KDA85_12665, partial [Planctomycetaceae bacterium]|nr:hypothetical protein [Planctomycetaceae bacterium]